MGRYTGVKSLTRLQIKIMSIKITDSNGISTIHTAERLEINLLTAKENVKEMIIYLTNLLLTGA